MATFDSAGVARKDGRHEPTSRRTPRGCGWPAAGCVVVGGGHVAQRRVPGLLAAGARRRRGRLPEITPAVEGLAGSGEVIWHRARLRGSATSTSAWYVIAATDDPAVNEQVSAAAEARRIFCVRSDDATAGHRLDARRRPARRRHRRGARQPGAAAVRRASATRSWPALRDGADRRAARRRQDARRGPGRRRPGRPRAGHGRGPPRAQRGRRGGRRPARAARAARRAVAGRRADRRRQAAAGPVGHPGGDQPGDRRAGARRQAGGPVQGRRLVRVRPRLRGGDRLRRGGRALLGRARPDQRDLRAGGGRASRSPTAASRTSSRWSPGTCRPITPTSLVDWDARRPAARHRRAADGRAEPARDRGRAHSAAAATRGPRWRWSPRARCRASGPCCPPSARSAEDIVRERVRPPAIVVVGDVVGGGQPGQVPVAELIEVDGPGRPAAGRLPRPARRRAAQAPRGRARAVPRRGREGGAPRGRGRLRRRGRS